MVNWSEIIIFCILNISLNISLNIFYETKRIFKILHLDKPLDFNQKLKDGQRILGESTTIGGLFFILIFGAILQYFFKESYAIYLAPLVYLGHSLGSFIKRRMKKPRGSYVPIIDHGDYIILNSLIFTVLGIITPLTAIVSIVIILILTPLITTTTYKLGLRDNPL